MRLLHAARLSRLRDDSTGIEKQDEQADQYAIAYGHEIVARARDTDVSGSTDPMKRPGLGPYLTDPNLMATYDGIIASALDRLGRNARHLIELKDWAVANSKTLILISPSLKWPIEDSNDFGGRMVWTILGELAEYELQAITKRNRETQKWLMENGFLHGKPPFGFNVVDKGNHKTLEPDPELEPVIREMAERYLAGASFTDLAEWLDSISVKPLSSERWAQNSLRRYLSNPALIGRRKDASGRTILKFKPVLDDETFRRVQVALGERGKKKGNPNDESLLSGIIRCARCGRPMSYHKAYNKRRDGTKVYTYYYRCHGTYRERSRCGNMVPLTLADDMVSAWVTEVIGSQKIIQRTLIPGRGHEEDIADVEADLRALDFDDPDYDEKSARLRAERKRLKDLPGIPAHFKEVELDITVREFWEGIVLTGVKRAWLAAGQVSVFAYMAPTRVEAPADIPEPTAVLPNGRPVTFSVESLVGGDWSISAAHAAEGIGVTTPEA